MLTTYQREQLKEEHSQNTNNFINVVLDSIGRKREIDNQNRLRQAQTDLIRQNIEANQRLYQQGYAQVQDPMTGISSMQQIPGLQSPQQNQPTVPYATPFAGGVPVPQGMSYRLSPQALAQQEQLNAQYQTPGQATQTGKTSAPPMFIQIGSPTGPKNVPNPDYATYVKNLGEQQKKETELKQSSKSLLDLEQVYLKQYGRSFEELKKYDPDIGRVGAGGKVSRIYGKVLKNLDEFPETKSLENLSKPIAQQIATQLEGRATDDDRKVQLDMLANALNGPTQENVRTAALNIIGIATRGGDIKPYVDELAKSKIKILNQIADAVYEDIPTLKESFIDSDELLKRYS